MNFAQKKTAYHQLQDPKYLDSDRDLLKTHDSSAPALSTGIVDKQKAQREIVWALLDVATVDEIEANRGCFSVLKTDKGGGPEKAELKAEVGQVNELVEEESSEKEEGLVSKIKKAFTEKKNPKGKK